MFVHMYEGVRAAVAQRLRDVLGEGAVIDQPANRGLVVLPSTAEEVQAVVRECARVGVPFAARGAGTGRSEDRLSEDALPVAEGVLVVTSRMRRVIEIDLPNQRAVVEPGVAGLAVTQAVAPNGYFYAADPFGRSARTVGGDVTGNHGGAHCMKYGFTVHQVTGLEICTPDGDLVWIGAGKAAEAPGYDLVGSFIGTEGTLGIATKVALRLWRAPQAVATVLATFRTPEQAAAAVNAIIAAGLTPAAVEFMDALAIEAAEHAVGSGYPMGAGAVLIVECAGPAAEVAGQIADVEVLCRAAGAFALHRADDPAERAEIWTGHRSAFAAVGRIAPDHVVRDGVIPRTALGEVLRRIGRLAEAAAPATAPVRVANVFHAGDGNLHSVVLYDARMAGAADAAAEVSGAIRDLCLALGRSITEETPPGQAVPSEVGGR
jgi:glycolate oxidase